MESLARRYHRSPSARWILQIVISYPGHGSPVLLLLMCSGKLMQPERRRAAGEIELASEDRLVAVQSLRIRSALSGEPLYADARSDRYLRLRLSFASYQVLKAPVGNQ